VLVVGLVDFVDIYVFMFWKLVCTLGYCGFFGGLMVEIFLGWGIRG